MKSGARLFLYIALGAIVAMLAVLLLGPGPNPTVSETAPSPISRAPAPTLVAPESARIVSTANDASRDVDDDRDASDAAANETPEAAPSAMNPFVAALTTGRDGSAMSRSPANDRPPIASPSAPGRTSEFPLGWCFAQTGFAGREANAGRAPPHELGSDTRVVYQGSASARIGAADGALPLEAVGVMWQAVAATPFRGKRVEMSAYARPRITRVGHFFVRTQGNVAPELWVSDQGAPGARGINQYIPRDAEWHRYRVVHDVPADAEVMYFGFALFGGGQVWIDDVRISIVDKASALSHYGSVAGTANIAIDPTWVLPAPLNLDFELTSNGPTGGAEASNPDCSQPVN